MADLAKVLWLDLRRTAIYLAVPALAVVGTVAAWRMLIPGVAYWDNAVAALLAATRVLGPICAGMAAWFAVRRRRLDHLRTLGERSPLTGPAVDLALFCGVTLFSYGVVTTIIVVRTLLNGEAGRPHFIGIVTGGLTVVTYVITGYLIGRAVPHLLVAPLVVVAATLWSTTRPTSWWRLLPPPAMGRIGLFATLRPSILAAQAVWLIAVLVTLIAAYAFVTSRRRLLAVPLAFAVAATLGATAWIHGQQSGLLSPVNYGSVCRQWPLTICVPPALSPGLPTLEETLTPFATLLQGTPGAFGKAQYLAENEERPPNDSTVYFFLDDLSPGYAHRVLEEIEISLVDAPVCGTSAHTAGSRYSAMVSAWLLNEQPPPNLNGTPAEQSFASWTDTQRRAWLQQHYAGFHECALDANDFRRI